MTDDGGLASPTYLNALEHVAVQTTGNSSVPVAGATFNLRFDATAFDGSYLTATKLSQDPNVQMISSMVDDGEGSVLMEVIILNPHGFNAESFDDLRNGKSYLKDLSFLVTWADGVERSIPSDFSLESSEYIDLNGNPIESLSASLGGGFGYSVD